MKKLKSILPILNAVILSILIVIFASGTTIVAPAAALANPNQVRLSAVAPKDAPPQTASPNYYYDRETAFVIKYAMDKTNKGIYTAVDANGNPYINIIPVSVFGFSQIPGTDKSHIGQAMCIRYFISEYQRVTTSKIGVTGINNILTGGPSPAPALNSPLDLLNQARSCADFATHLEIPAAAQASTVSPNRLYYWSFSNRDGTGSFIDDTLPNGAVGSSARSESILPWSIAELGLALKQAGQPDYTTYLNEALRWWNWRQTTAAALPVYSDPNKPRVSGSCTTPGLNPDNCIPGVGRDVFYPALGFTLSDLTSNPGYRTTAITFANSKLGTGNAPTLYVGPYSIPVDPYQEGAYTAGYGRGIIFAEHAQQNMGPLTDRDQWWDFGNYPAVITPPNLDPPASNPVMTDGNLSVPFAGFRGRELVAGTLRSLWFFYTFGADPNMFYQTPKPSFTEANTQQAVVAYWNFANAKFWDNTPGVAAWFEALNQPYKPCFSSGTEVPIADWQPPIIGNKVHTLNADRSATVTVSGVSDPDFPYLSWKFKGSGIASVEVVYTTDNGTNWNVIPATATTTTGTYTATIPPQPLGTTVHYYARAHDYFSNYTAFPAGAETWSSDGVSLGRSITNTQTYSFSSLTTTTPTTTVTSTPTVTATMPTTITPTTTAVTTTPPTATATTVTTATTPTVTATTTQVATTTPKPTTTSATSVATTNTSIPTTTAPTSSTTTATTTATTITTTVPVTTTQVVTTTPITTTSAITTATTVPVTTTATVPESTTAVIFTTLPTTEQPVATTIVAVAGETATGGYPSLPKTGSKPLTHSTPISAEDDIISVIALIVLAVVTLTLGAGLILKQWKIRL